MAATKENKLDTLTSEVTPRERTYDGPRVQILLPALEHDEENGINIDQYEHVTISNEKGEKVYYVKRGEYVEVPVPVFLALKERYPKL